MPHRYKCLLPCVFIFCFGLTLAGCAGQFYDKMNNGIDHFMGIPYPLYMYKTDQTGPKTKNNKNEGTVVLVGRTELYILKDFLLERLGVEGWTLENETVTNELRSLTFTREESRCVVDFSFVGSFRLALQMKITVSEPIINYAPATIQIADAKHASKKIIATSQYKNKFALVIGNGKYNMAPLANPTRDADDVAQSLRSLGFNVIQKNDVDLRNMEIMMDRFYASLGKGSVGLFYYAGHGVQIDGKNYLVPVDATINSSSDVKYECMDAGRILGKMEDAGNSMNIVVLDACRNNPFASSFRSASRGLARMDAPAGSIIAYSTAPGKVASDGTGRNGVYTKHFLKHLMTPDLNITDVFTKTRIDVVRETAGKQIPWESSSLLGYFYFIEDQ